MRALYGSTMKRAFDWMFRNRKSGGYTVVQWPNIALGAWIACAVLRAVFAPKGAQGDVVSWVGSIALAVWALDEIARGVNPFRRILGGVVLIGLVAPGVS
jgi:hypothetical protein